MNDYQIFQQLLIQALSRVEPKYFHTPFDQFYAIRGVLMNYGRFDGERFYRYSERGFAYELYHQLRILIDHERSQRDFFPEYYLQGEIKKIDLFQLREVFGYFSLGGNVIPDMLFHVPSQDQNAFVIEIKAQPELSEGDLEKDLLKLSRFLNGYYYQKAVFLSVNMSDEHLHDLIRSMRDFIINEFSVERLSDCNIISKSRSEQEAPISNLTLSELLL